MATHPPLSGRIAPGKWPEQMVGKTSSSSAQKGIGSETDVEGVLDYSDSDSHIPVAANFDEPSESYDPLEFHDECGTSIWHFF